MSSLVAAPSEGGDRTAPAAPGRRLPARYTDPLGTLALAALLIGVVFVGRGGSALARTTTVELALI
ncbi:MAG TPA: hypothetical protein VK506_08135, partial [Conexibacter sp.]|nr:hypothetical protein [Conexibacter sp.]